MEIVGIDPAKPGSERTVCECPKCRRVHNWPAGKEPQKCACGFPFNWTGLRVVKPKE